MTFPDEFEISGKRADVQRQLGNAVPVELGKAVISSLAKSLGHLQTDTDAGVFSDGSRLTLKI